jgi:hypothetical protein
MLKVFSLFLCPFLHHDFIAEFDALIANVHGGSGNQLFNFFLIFATKRASVIACRSTFLWHGFS